jgi:amidase
MLYRVTAEKTVYSFDKRLEPVLQIESGDEVIFETKDARGGRAMFEYEQYVVPSPPPLEKGNPVTGPVAIQGAEKGDTLLIEVEDIKLGSKGYLSVRQDMGVLKDLVKQPGARVIRIKDSRILFNETISFPTRPMIGTIGLAPLLEDIPSIYPGPHGGNMDCNDITIGAKVFLPVHVKGALFFLGDVHASMGDGEVSGGGLDIAADVKVKISVLKNIKVITPLVESKSNITIIYNAPKLEEAIRGVVKKSISLLEERIGLSLEDALRIVSSVGDLGICQSCESLIDVVVRMRLPKFFEVI